MWQTKPVILNSYSDIQLRFLLPAALMYLKACPFASFPKCSENSSSEMLECCFLTSLVNGLIKYFQSIILIQKSSGYWFIVPSSSLRVDGGGGATCLPPVLPDKQGGAVGPRPHGRPRPLRRVHHSASVKRTNLWCLSTCKGTS